MSKKQQRYYVSRRFDVRLGIEITAKSFEDALAETRALTFTDMVKIASGVQYESCENLPGMGVSEVDDP